MAGTKKENAVVEKTMVKTEATVAAPVAAPAVKEAVAADKPVPKKPGPKPKAAAAKDKPAAKKASAEKAKAPVKRTVANKAPTVSVKLEFNNKSYTRENVVNSATDVWVHDIGRPASELKKIELYVKPEEEKVYYIFNGDISGSFNI